MKYSRLFPRLAAAITALMILTAAPASAQDSTRGKCSPIIVMSSIKELKIDCSEGHPELVAVVERVNRLIAETALTRDQVRELAVLMNEFAGAQTGRRRLAGVMATWSAAALRTYGGSASPDAKVYIALLDPADPGFGTGRDRLIYYQITTIDASNVGDGLSCKVSAYASIGGMKGTGTEGRDGSVRATLTPLTTSDPVFRRICKQMASPWASVIGRDGGGAASGGTVYDYLVTGKPALGLMLMPGIKDGVRADQVRPYWASAFAARTLGVQPAVEMGPEAYAAATRAEATNGSYSIDIDAVPTTFSGATYDKPYPAEVLQEFGPELERMDAEWLEYIADASVLIRGQRVRLFENGRSVPILRLHRLGDLDTSVFWQQIGDTSNVIHQQVCLAARFAIDFGYVTAGDLPDYGLCGMRLRTR